MKKALLIITFLGIAAFFYLIFNSSQKQSVSSVVYNSSAFNAQVFADERKVGGRLESSGAGIEFSFLSSNAVHTKEDSADLYKVSDDTLIKYEVVKEGTQQGLKETIILKNKNAKNVYEFDLNLKNVKNFLPEPEEKSWLFYNEQDELIFYIPAGFMVDANGARSDDVKIGITKKEGDNYELKVTADRLWLDSSERAYPVDIDPSVIVSGGFTETEAQFGTLQRKVVYANSNWYAFYGDGTDVVYKKSSDGSSWGSAQDVDSSDADNLSVTTWLEGNYIYVAWIDDSTDSIEVNRIDTSSEDSLGTKCTGANQGTLDDTNVVSIAVADDGTVYFAYSDTSTDTEHGVFKLVYSGCTFTDIDTVAITASNLANGKNGTDAQTMQTSSISPTSNCLILFAFQSREVDDTFNEPNSITGNGLTWVQVSTAVNQGGGSRYFGLYRALGSSPSNGTITVDWAGTNTSDYLIYSIDQFCNVDTSGTNGSGAIVQAPTPGGNSTGTTGSVSLSAFGDATNNVAYGASMHHALEATTPDASGGWAELADVTCGAGDGCDNDRSMETQWKTGQDTTITSTWATSGRWGQFGVEIKSAGGLSGLIDSDSPVLVTVGNNLHMIYQDGNLSHSIFDGSNWTTSNTTIASVTDSSYSLTTDGTDLWLLSVSGSTATNFYEYSGGSWSVKTAPWSGQTNLTQASITYDSGNDDLYASVIKDASEQAYWKSTDAGSISWSSESSFGFTAGDLGQLSMPLTVTSAILAQTAVLRQNTNYEYSQSTPTPVQNRIKGTTRIGGNTRMR